MSRKLSYRDVVTDVVKTFNRAMRPFIGRNVAALKGDRIVFLNGKSYSMSKGCKLMIRYARICHRHYFNDSGLRKKYHDVLYHQWYFERPAMKKAEEVRNEETCPVCQRKTPGHGLMVLKRNKCSKDYRCSPAVHTEY